MFEKVEDTQSSVDNSQPDRKTMSVTALESVKNGIICGIVKSLGIYLLNNEAEIKNAEKKVRLFINALVAGKDLSANDASWQMNSYFSTLKSSVFATDPECCSPCCSSAYLSWYMVIANLIDDPHVYEWAFDAKAMKSMTEHEKTLVSNLRELQQKYNEARSAFEKYFSEVNRQELRSILLKYGTTLGQIAPKWFRDIRCSAGLNDADSKIRGTIGEPAADGNN